MSRLLLFASTLSLLLSSNAQRAQATGSEAFRWEVGAGTAVCGIEPTACPDVAMASNGDTITVRAQGDFETEGIPRGDAEGGGTFEHRTSAGTLVGSGTLTAKRLLDFTFYGCGGFGFPNTFCGGRAKLLVRLVEFPASNPSAKVKTHGILVVTCLFGNPPSGAEEGFTLDVKGGLNFDKSVGGDTLFIPEQE